MNLYRFTLNSKGIYAELDAQVQKDSPLRNHKPDGSWLPKVGTDYPGAISFFTTRGLQKYNQTGLKNWHYSAAEGKAKMHIAEAPLKSLYQDEFQVIAMPEDFNIKHTYEFVYEGPTPPVVIPSDERPSFIRHHRSIQDHFAYAFYSGSDESFTTGASYSDLGLKNLGIHYETLAPGKRSSWPHAHLVEEEFVIVLEGTPDAWVNHKLVKTKPMDVLFFPPGSNLAHTMVNNTNTPIKMLVIGEQNQENDKIYYPLHPERNKECEEQKFFWSDRPKAPTFTTHKNIYDLEQKDSGGIDEVQHYFTKGRDFGRALGAQRVALHHQVIMPGHRSGIPHAESLEEEFIFVLKGSLSAWINGRRYEMNEGDACALAAGTGILHTFINDSSEEVEILLIGETWKDDNQYTYGINPELNEPDKPGHWHEHPKQDIGDESSIPKSKK